MVSARTKKLQLTKEWHNVEDMEQAWKDKRAWKMVREFTNSCDGHPVSEWCSENRARRHMPLSEEGNEEEDKYVSFLTRITKTLERDPLDAERYRFNQAGIKKNARKRAALKKLGWVQVPDTYEPAKHTMIGDKMPIDGPYEVPEEELTREWVLRMQCHAWGDMEAYEVEDKFSHLKAKRERRT